MKETTDSSILACLFSGFVLVVAVVSVLLLLHYKANPISILAGLTG